MENKTEFQRIFLIFTGEDTGYESAQKPSGHVKIEVREGKGRLWATVQNLLESGRFGYRLYLVDTASGKGGAVPVGVFGLTKNKGTLEWGFDPSNVAGAGRSIEDYGTAAVLVEYYDRENTSVNCPLAAYRGKKTNWRNGLAERLYKKESKHEAPSLHEAPIPKDIKSKYEVNAESKYILPETGPELNAVEPHTEVNVVEAPLQSSENQGAEGPEAVGKMEEPGNVEPASENTYAALPEQPVQPLTQDTEVHWEHEPQLFQQAVNQAGYPDPAVGLDTNCLYLNSNMCGAYVNAGAANPCAGCTVHNRPAVPEDRSGKYNLEKLREELDKNFESCDPFHMKRSDYAWWKVTNPVNLNNILYQCNIRSPLLFNPAVMMSHFKYKHLIIGIYTDGSREKEYVVCGIFGMYMVDRKPFGDMCKWVQTEGMRPKYGAYGYWLVYLDPATGRILSLK